jgi:hypothetical protein
LRIAREMFPDRLRPAEAAFPYRLRLPLASLPPPWPVEAAICAGLPRPKPGPSRSPACVRRGAR